MDDLHLPLFERNLRPFDDQSSKMQFTTNALSSSYSVSLPRDEFLAAAFTPADEAEQLRADKLEERRLRRLAREKQRQKRSRRPSTLHSFILGDNHEDPLLEQSSEDSEDDEEDHDELGSVFDEESAFDGESRVSGATSNRQGRYGATSTTSDAGLLPPSTAVNNGRKLSTKSSRRPSALAPIGENTALINRRASMATLTPKPLQKIFTGPTSNASRKELAILTWYMIPIFLTHLLEYSLLLATIVSVGHLGTAELAASSLGSMTTNVCALSLIQGLCVSLCIPRIGPNG